MTLGTLRDQVQQFHKHRQAFHKHSTICVLAFCILISTPLFRQVIYPHTRADMRLKGVTDADLLGFLEDVKLSCEWRCVL
jgi:hypothetical protein